MKKKYLVLKLIKSELMKGYLKPDKSLMWSIIVKTGQL